MDFSRASMNSGVPRGRPVCVHWRRAATSTSDSPAPRYSRHADAVQRSRHGPISSKTSAVVAPQCAAPLDRFHSWRVVRPIAKRRAGPLTFFHHKRLVSAITDLQPPVDDNEDRPVAGPRCARHQDAPRSCPSPTSRRSLKIPNLGQEAGVSPPPKPREKRKMRPKSLLMNYPPYKSLFLNYLRRRPANPMILMVWKKGGGRGVPKNQASRSRESLQIC